MTIDIYSFHMSPSCRAVLMTAKELNIDLNIKTIDLSEGQQFTPEFLKMNPAHSIPTIDDDGFVLWESRAIMQYLCNKYAPDSPLYPKEPKKRAIVDRWLNFDMTLIESSKQGLLVKVFMGIEPTEDKVQSFKNNLKLLETLIGDKKYLTGDNPTIADLSVLASTVILYFIEYDFSELPNLKRWLTGLSQELPYFAELLVVSKEEIESTVAKMQEYMNKKLNS